MNKHQRSPSHTIDFASLQTFFLLVCRSQVNSGENNDRLLKKQKRYALKKEQNAKRIFNSEENGKRSAWDVFVANH